MPERSGRVKGGAHRALYVAIGSVAVALGVIGMIVPGMPTTIFLIIASYFFARSSPPLDTWLHNHRLFGPSLRRFRETGGMPRRAKAVALASMWTGVALSCLALGVIGRSITCALGVAGTVTIVWAVKTVES